MVIFHSYVSLPEGNSMCHFFFGRWGWNSIGVFSLLSIPKIPSNSQFPFKRHGHRLFSTPHQILRYTHFIPTVGANFQVFLACRWVTAYPWMVLSRQRFARHGLLFLISQARMMGKFREIRIPQLGVKDQPNTYGSYGFIARIQEWSHWCTSPSDWIGSVISVILFLLWKGTTTSNRWHFVWTTKGWPCDVSHG